MYHDSVLCKSPYDLESLEAVGPMLLHLGALKCAGCRDSLVCVCCIP